MRYEKPEMIVKIWKDGDVFTNVEISGGGVNEKIDGSPSGDASWN